MSGPIKRRQKKDRAPASAWMVNRPKDARSAEDFEPAWGWHDMERAYYVDAASNADSRRDVSVGAYYAEGGCIFEWACRWPILGGQPTFKMEMFGDSLSVVGAEPWRAFFMELCVRADTFDDKAAFLAFMDEAGCFDLTAVARRPDGAAFAEAAAKELARMEAEQIGQAAGSAEAAGISARKQAL